MIRLHPRPDPPVFFQDEAVKALERQVSEFYAVPEKSRRQHKFEFPLLPRKIFGATLDALLEYALGKCVYCETPIRHPGNASLDRFRPKAGALDQAGHFSTEHYWWLAFEWRNLYACCAPCNRNKGSKFPVNGRRVKPGTPYEELNEARLLLDPGTDDPQGHLAFFPDGTVAPNTAAADATIATLELNRTDLVSARREVAVRVQHTLNSSAPLVATLSHWGEPWRARLGEALHAAGAKLGKSFVRLATDVADEAPYAAAARAVVQHFLDERNEVAKGALPSSIPRAPRLAKTAKAITPLANLGQLHSQIVTRVQLNNFRGISDLDLPIDYSLGTGAPWTVLLGENGAGKSSILQAIALTLLEKDAPASAVRPKTVLRKGAASGYVRVWFHGSKAPRELLFRRGARRFERRGPPYGGTLLGYGATRLLPRHRVAFAPGTIRLENMFDPFQPLIDANRWLGSLSKRDFDFVARALREVIGLPRSATLRRLRSRSEQGVRLKQHGADLTLEELSDGYQSVLGLTCDIIASLRVLQSGALDASEAVVIIDELGAHLHPRWRMRIVTSLRRAFKRVQFIASTHDPLCLRGLENGEAAVLRRTDRGRVYSVPELPPIKGLRVEQLLTSEFFGLSSTLDPAIEAHYRELYRLLAVREPTAKIEARIAELREELAPYELPGATRRERRLLQVIDRELAQMDATADPAEREQIRSENETIMNAVLRPNTAQANA